MQKPSSEPELDLYDRRILAALATDGRISWRDLAALIGLSLTPTIRRVRRLEADGYIKGYTAIVDEARLGQSISVFVAVSLDVHNEDTLARFEERVMRAPEVMSCHMLTGTADYMLRVVAPDLHAFQDFLVHTLSRIPGVRNMQSSFALKPVIQRTAPPLA